jgi:hypothetical protein
LFGFWDVCMHGTTEILLDCLILATRW